MILGGAAVGSSFCVDVKKNLWRSASLLASPWGEVASRSDDGEGTASVAIYILRCNEKFFRESLWRVVYFMLNIKKRLADGNFVWNQDEVPQNSR